MNEDHGQGLCKIVTNAGSGVYTVTQLFWNPTTNGYDDAAAPAGFVAKTARDYRNRANGIPASSPLVETDVKPFWVQTSKELTREVLIDIGGETDSSFPVIVEKYGGNAGGAAQECSYTYTAKAMDGSTVLVKNTNGDLATEMTPEVPRLHFVEYYYAGETRAAPASATSTLGLACRLTTTNKPLNGDAPGDLKLLICYGEIAKEASC